MEKRTGEGKGQYSKKWQIKHYSHSWWWYRYVYDEDFVKLTCHTSDWVINSGASFHVTAHRDNFTSYANGDYDRIWMGNEGAFKIVGKWDICFKTNVNCK